MLTQAITIKLSLDNTPTYHTVTNRITLIL